MKDGKPYFFGSGESYSTEEQVIGTWIDGKPIYRKTIQIDAPTSTTSTMAFGSETDFCDIATVTTSLDDLNIECLISNHGVLHTDTYIYVPYPVTYNCMAHINGWYNSENKMLYIRFGEQYCIKGILTVTLEYTKTTD